MKPNELSDIKGTLKAHVLFTPEHEYKFFDINVSNLYSAAYFRSAGAVCRSEQAQASVLVDSQERLRLTLINLHTTSPGQFQSTP